jgi:MFS family permease
MSPIKEIRKVILASSLGTLIEWYDFYIFGSLATVISSQFFPKANPTAGLLSTLGTFAAGFIVRPFGALVFGRLGDLIGRKYTFLLTLILMGSSTFAIGLIPGYERIGFAAPLIVLLLRLLQGLALGGEYGGAATYVAEHAPDNKRGLYTSWIQTTATLGLLLSLGVILLTRHLLDPDLEKSVAKFNSWGWRIPFLLSIVLLLVSLYVRLKMKESPMYSRLKTQGKTSTRPLQESFGRKVNLKIVLLALFGATMGQGVIWYTGQFYAQSFIENVCKIEFDQSRTIVIWAILFATPFYILFGKWSDRLGRKWIMIWGMLLAVLTYRFLFGQLISVADPAAKKERVELRQFQTTLTAIGNSGNSWRTRETSSYYEGGMSLIESKKDTLYSQSGKTSKKVESKITKVLGGAGYWEMVAIVFVMILYATMVYGPIAAFLVELFPTKIRYTSMSLPYHIGNGVFGGLTPFIATLLTTIYIGDKLVGLFYPIIVATICLIIGSVYIPARATENNFGILGTE